MDSDESVDLHALLDQVLEQEGSSPYPAETSSKLDSALNESAT